METNPYLKDNEVVSNDNEVILEYEKPQLYKRVFSNIIDMILVFIVSVSLISLSLSIYNKSESYTNSNKIMNDVKIQSGFYKEIDDTLIFLTDELESATEKTYEEKLERIEMYESILNGLANVEEGKIKDGPCALKELKAKYDL